MSMEIKTKAFKHCHVVTVTGRVDSSTAPEFSKALDGLIDKGEFRIVIDMGGLEYMSSAGFRALLGAQRQCRRYNRGEVLLASVPTRIREALELAGFTELFKTFPGPLEAVGSI
jgi:anti-sigma B factor antagonist